MIVCHKGMEVGWGMGNVWMESEIVKGAVNEGNGS